MFLNSIFLPYFVFIYVVHLFIVLFCISIVFNFLISDQGTADGAPTYVTQLVFNAGLNNTVAGYRWLGRRATFNLWNSIFIYPAEDVSGSQIFTNQGLTLPLQITNPAEDAKIP